MNAAAFGGRARVAVVVVVALVLGGLIASGSRASLLAVALIVAASVALVTFGFREGVLLGWFAIAPFMQEIARISTVGNVLNYGVYLLGGALVIVWAALATAEAVRTRRLRPIDLAPIAYVALVAGWVVLGTVLPEGWTRVDFARQAYANIALPVGAYLVVRYAVAESFPLRWQRVLWMSALAVTAAALIEAATGFNVWGFVRWQAVDIGRVVGPLGNPAVLGTMLGAAVASAFAYLLWERPKTGGWTGICLLVVVFGSVAVWFTYARASLLALVIALVLVGIRNSGLRYSGVVALILVVVVLIASWATLSDSRVVRQRFGDRANAQVRILLAGRSVQLSMAHPVAGWGYGSFDAIRGLSTVALPDIPSEYAADDTSHNSYLTVLVETGWLGLVLSLLPWVGVGVRALRRLILGRSTDWVAYACLGVGVVYVVNASFIDMRFFSYPALLGWMALGLLGSRLAAEDEAAADAAEASGAGEHAGRAAFGRVTGA